MNTIWKYVLDITDKQTLFMPREAEFLHVGEQNGRLCVWAEVDTDNGLEPVDVFICGTGNQLPVFGAGVLYVGTAQVGEFVWHVYS